LDLIVTTERTAVSLLGGGGEGGGGMSSHGGLASRSPWRSSWPAPHLSGRRARWAPVDDPRPKTSSPGRLDRPRLGRGRAGPAPPPPPPAGPPRLDVRRLGPGAARLLPGRLRCPCPPWPRAPNVAEPPWRPRRRHEALARLGPTRSDRPCASCTASSIRARRLTAERAGGAFLQPRPLQRVGRGAAACCSTTRAGE